jgi:glyoxylase-like metal-dependent hydrolase (beta-lactamase superfamily II)
VQEVAPGISMIDTMLGGLEGVTASYLVAGERPALVETGARTSAPALREALAAAGMGAADLAWIVLTHVHLDHCGGTGIIAAAFPRATVVVHRRGARHLAEPGRLVAASAAVYGARWSLYGGLDRTPAARIVPADDRHRVPLGGGRELVMLETPGHARHHMAVLDEASGTVLAGDALGARFPGGGLYPALPPPEIDLAAGLASLDRLTALAPERLCLGHFGPLPDPLAGIALARGQLGRVEAAARSAGTGPRALCEALERALPLAESVNDAAALARWRRLGWAEANVEGLAGWLARSPTPSSTVEAP